jgi:ATP-binding cassette subfamily C protein CydC
VNAFIKDLDLTWTRIARSVVLGSAALGSAVGLTAASAWLIARAAEMPSPADLALAAVFVRALGIGRGVFRYVERLASHDTALKGVAALRATAYERLEAGKEARVVALPRGEAVSRLGSDLDSVGDAVVRALVPAGVALVVSSVSVAVVGSQHRPAAALLAGCLVVGSAASILLTARATRIAEEEGVEAEADVANATLSAMEGAIEHRVWGRTDDVSARLATANRDLERARDSAARPAALAAAVLVLVSGAALVGTIALVTTGSGSLTGPAAAVVALTPLAAFESVAALPAATAQAYRSRAAMRRISALVDTADRVESQPPPPHADSDAAVRVDLVDVAAAWPGSTPTRPVSVGVGPGEVLGLVGPSGIGKTTLLLTLAGALPPASGRVALNGRDAIPADMGATVAMTAEDGHVFGTSILENLRVARGNVTEREAREALDTVGLGPWLSYQPTGLDTSLGSGGLSVSGGERRRLLLARAMLHPAPVHLIDEPAEHLDEAGADVVRSAITRMASDGKTVVIVTHDHAILDVVDTVVDLGKGD